MGRGTGSALLARAHEDGSADATDHRLVAAVRRGDDRAFELLYQRYHRRIHAYVLGMVKDHGRAEDVTQEVFVSALRRMRATERPIAFKPWVYEIAKNACIDVFRRSKRAEEVSYDAEDGPGPVRPRAARRLRPDARRGGGGQARPRVAVGRVRRALRDPPRDPRAARARGAVLRGHRRPHGDEPRRRGVDPVPRPAPADARNTTSIVSGARCLRIQAIIQIAARSRLGARDTRRLARHLAHCQPCRREAMEAGLDRGLLARPPVRERIASRVAGLLPFPIFARLRHGGDATSSSSAGGRGAGLISHLPLVSDHLGDGWGRLVAGGALLVAGVGAGVGVHDAATARHHAAAPARPAALTAHHVASSRAPAPAPRTRAAADHTTFAASVARAPRRVHRAAVRGTHSGAAARRAAPATQAAPAPAQAQAKPAAARAASPAATTVATAVPAATAAPVQQVKDTVNQAAGAVNTTVQQTTGAVNNAVQGAAGGTPVGQTVQDATNAVQQATGGVTDPLTGH